MTNHKRKAARKAYEEAIEPARQVYQEAREAAGKAYQKAIEPAWEAYQEAREK